MNGELPEFEDRVRKLLKQNEGREVWSPNQTFVFRFARHGESETLMTEWREQARLRKLQLIGYFGNGDTVCAHPTGELCIGFCDEDSELAWWETDVKLEDLLQRVDALDEGIEEYVFSRGPKA